MNAKLPLSFNPIPPILPDRCYIVDTHSIPTHSRNKVESFYFRCNGSSMGVDDSIFFPWEREGVLVSAFWLDGQSSAGFFNKSTDGITVPISELRTDKLRIFDTIKIYVLLGVEHIALGWDHLAFVLALCLIAWGWQLVKLITAFTLGHSLTLGLASLGFAQIPIPPVEACIALSIAFVAREAIVKSGISEHGVGIVLAFGLLHGLGFASALTEAGIKQSELLLGLVAFNIGVELGQLAFVLAVVLIVQLFKSLKIHPSYFRLAVARGLGIIAMFWTFARIYIFVY